MNENELSNLIIGAAIKVHREIGPGLFESVYEECLCKEFSKLNLKIERQKKIDLIYNGENVGLAFKADILVEDCVLIELKSVEKLHGIHFTQTYSYIKLLNIKLGLLINFNESLLKNGIKRVVNKI
ncbi:MAG: GxxExxY protein [Sphingobacteriales bacterium]|nr:GxxExxY protein [Sphingobacteriales bacterium]